MAECLLLKAGGGVSSDDLTAKKGQVLSGYTAVTADSGDEAAGGTMPNHGELNWSESNTTKTVAAGYYSGGTLDSRPSYNKGVSDADGRVNSDSESYKKGYEAGYNDGYSTGKKEGYESGHSAGYEEGHDAGYKEGYESFLGGSTLSNTVCTDFGGSVSVSGKHDPLWTERKFDKNETFEVPKKYSGGTLYALDITIKHDGGEAYGQEYSASGSYNIKNHDGTSIESASYGTTGNSVDHANVDFMTKPYSVVGDKILVHLIANGKVRLINFAAGVDGNQSAHANMQFTVVAKYKIPKS